MNAELMCKYIEAVADRIADLFEFERVFNTEKEAKVEAAKAEKEESDKEAASKEA